MSRVALKIDRVVTPDRRVMNVGDVETKGVAGLMLDEHATGVVVNALSKARDRETMPHNQQILDLVTDALTQAVR